MIYDNCDYDKETDMWCGNVVLHTDDLRMFGA